MLNLLFKGTVFVLELKKNQLSTYKSLESKS